MTTATVKEQCEATELCTMIGCSDNGKLVDTEHYHVNHSEARISDWYNVTPIFDERVPAWGVEVIVSRLDLFTVEEASALAEDIRSVTAWSERATRVMRAAAEL